MSKTKKIAFLGLITAFALILSYVEMLLPPLFPSVPGIKMGLCNILIVFMLYNFSLKEAAAVSLIRLLLVSLLFGSVLGFIYSLAGAFLSLTVMYLLKKSGLFSTVGVSVAGGVSHNLAQVIVAIILMHTAEIGYYMIALTVTGVISGCVVGICGGLLLKYLKRTFQ